MTDQAILSVINPPASQRDRSSYLDSRRPLYDERGVTLPGQSKWRNTPTVGAVLNPASQVVRSNHYRVDTSKVPSTFWHYHVHIYRYDREGAIVSTDIAPEEDVQVTVQLVYLLRKNHPEWETIGGITNGITYDGRSSIFTSSQLPLPDRNEHNEPTLAEDIRMLNLDGSASAKKYRLAITMIEVIYTASGAAWATADINAIRALDTAVFSFARWQAINDNPDWFVIGSKAFKGSAPSFPLSPAYVARRGYFAGLKSCLAGLVLVSDMSVTGFLTSGEMLNVMYMVGGYHNFNALVDDFSRPSNPGLKRKLDVISDGLKNCKVRLSHLGHKKKARGLGPPANSKESEFDCDGRKVTVADYFVNMAKTKPQYRDALKASGGRLKYPQLPTINVGTSSHPVLIPAELCIVPGGQCRSHKMVGDMTAQLIRHAAVRPDERMAYITDNTDDGGSIVNVLRTDRTASAFGLTNISAAPIACAATLLPQAKLKYGNAVVDPMFNGTWNMERQTFARLPPGRDEKGYMYGIVITTDRGFPEQNMQYVKEFTDTMERDANIAGIKMRSGGPPMISSTRPDDLKSRLEKMKAGGARIVLMVQYMECYCEIKLVADKLGQATQCLKWKNIERPPRGYHLNVMLKINTKIGGTNHTLVSRLPSAPSQTTFQDPPASLSWLFDKPCMLVGVDVSHADPGSDRESMAAVVASMDGRASQYVAHISAQPARMEIVSALEDAMKRLLESFKARNRDVPSYIIVYRDGVGDGQFEEVVNKELPAIKNALALMGYQDDRVKVAMVICQKGHHTRFVYEEKAADGSPTYINPCPGLCIDANGGTNSIASAKINEFYLNSHAAIQGTCKPCKYALVYDEIGFKTSELEILTYWTCYLYARCNKSVSYATPAYYAHWASKRAKNLFTAGATASDLIDISETWAAHQRYSSMFFI